MQISQCSLVFAHWVTCVQGGHATGSLNLSAVQVAARRIALGAPGIWQDVAKSWFQVLETLR